MVSSVYCLVDGQTAQQHTKWGLIFLYALDTRKTHDTGDTYIHGLNQSHYQYVMACVSTLPSCQQRTCMWYATMTTYTSSLVPSLSRRGGGYEAAKTAYYVAMHT